VFLIENALITINEWTNYSRNFQRNGKRNQRPRRVDSTDAGGFEYVPRNRAERAFGEMIDVGAFVTDPLRPYRTPPPNPTN